jgi:hypothetical protein
MNMAKAQLLGWQSAAAFSCVHDDVQLQLLHARFLQQLLLLSHHL